MGDGRPKSMGRKALERMSDNDARSVAGEAWAFGTKPVETFRQREDEIAARISSQPGAYTTGPGKDIHVSPRKRKGK